MNLSSLLSKEISKKRKSKLKKEKSKKQKIQEEIAVPDTPDNVVENVEEPLTPKQLQILNLSDKEIENRLKEYNAFDSESNRIEKVKKLWYLDKQKDKEERYKIQRDKESKVDKLFRLDEITNLKYKSKLLIQLRVYIKFLVNSWDQYVQDPTVEDESNQRELLDTTKIELVVLLYNLRSDKLNDDMVTSLSTIVYYLQSKEYLKANESYIKLSIGNVAWPIGVSGYNIHERSADSKITGESNTANIMIDEPTRKWMTAIKRLITFHEQHPDISTIDSS